MPQKRHRKQRKTTKWISDSGVVPRLVIDLELDAGEGGLEAAVTVYWEDALGTNTERNFQV